MQDIWNYASAWCGDYDYPCQNGIFAQAYASWYSVLQTARSDYETALQNGTCNSNPSYCNALQQDVEDLSLLLNLIAGSMSS